jgi:hypothetical protein
MDDTPDLLITRTLASSAPRADGSYAIVLDDIGATDEAASRRGVALVGESADGLGLVAVISISAQHDPTVAFARLAAAVADHARARGHVRVLLTTDWPVDGP